MSTVLKRATMLLAGVMPLVAAFALYLVSKEYMNDNIKGSIGITLVMLLVLGMICLVYGLLVVLPFIKMLFLPKHERAEALEAHGELLVTATTLQKVLAIPALILLVIAVSRLVTVTQLVLVIGSFWMIILIPFVAILAMITLELPVVGIVIFFLLFGITFVMSLPAMLGQLERLLAKRCRFSEFLFSIIFLCFPLADVIYLLVTKLDNKHALKQSVIYMICFVALIAGIGGSITTAVQCEKQYSILGSWNMD